MPAGATAADATAAPGAGAESFRGFHDDITRQSLVAAAEQHYKLALAYDEFGMPDLAIKELHVAVRSPRRRFESAAMLGRACSRSAGPLARCVPPPAV